MSSYDIAVVGMGCVFPEANNVEEYWKNILSGKQFIKPMPDNLWHMDSFTSKEKNDYKSVTKKGSFLKDFKFNALDYGIPPKNLEGVDKAQLVGIEATRQALQDAGIKPKSKELEDAITIIGGSGVDEYAHVSAYINRTKFFRKFTPYLNELGLNEKEKEELFQDFTKAVQERGHEWHPAISTIGGVVSSIPNRIAQVFGVKGFNMVVDGACGSSFVALSVACNALLAGDAKIAIAGGVDLGINPAIYIGFSKLGGLSVDGASNPFDKDANGLVIGEGGGVVILKRLEDAIADGDKIHSVIKGIGSSSDGAGQAIYNPSAKQRSIAMKKALKVANIAAKDVQFLEAHATSTVVGDANEYDAISMTYGGDREGREPLNLGTVKFQIGHLKAAAGIAGLIKTILAMSNNTIPHMPGFKELTPLAKLKSDSLVVPTKLQEWKALKNGSKYAAITTSGFGGVNYHTIIEQAPEYKIPERKKVERKMAIVGISSRLPGANDEDTFWKNISSGKNLFTDVDPVKMKWEDNFITGPENERINVKKVALINETKVNSLRLRIPPKSISQTSPAQLLSVEIADKLLTDYGLDIKDNKNIGVSIGAMHDDNYSDISFPLYIDEYIAAINQTKKIKSLDKKKLELSFEGVKKQIIKDGPPHTEATLPGWMSNINAGIVANRLNCTGSNYTVDTACSSGLAAFLPAMYQLMYTDVDMMIAGGLNRHTSAPFVSAVGTLDAMSEDKAAPFDESGDGFLPGEGGVLYLLKRYSDAKKDGDKIYGVIHNISGSSEYASKSMVAPSEIALRHSIKQGLSKSGINPDQIGVVDTHGSANKLSDILEAQSLAKELRANSSAKPLHLTAIKSHIGHLYGGSGAAGMLSVLKSLEHKKVPGISNLKNIRPEIKDILHLVQPQKGTTELDSSFTAGGINSLGLGGSNFFGVVSLDDDDNNSKTSKADVEMNDVFVCKASSNEELISLLEEFVKTGDKNMINNSNGDIRLTVSFDNDTVLKQKISQAIIFLKSGKSLKPLMTQGVYHNNLSKTQPKLTFCFPGQGTHYISMGKELYNTNSEFKQIIDKVDELAVARFNFELKKNIYGNVSEQEANENLSTLEGAQISLFAIELALAKVYEQMGVKPSVMIGHSFGEISALAFQGVWDLETAFEVVAARIEAAKLGNKQGKYKMLSIICTEEQKDALLDLAGDNVVLANTNAPGQFILAGVEKDVLKTAETAETLDYDPKVLQIGSAFHSKFMEIAVDAFRKSIEKLPTNKLTTPILSTITGKYIEFKNSKELALHLSKQLTTPINMPRDINKLYKDGITEFLEVGPRWALTKMIEATLNKKDYRAVPSLHPKVGDEETFRRAKAYLASIDYIKTDANNSEEGGIIGDKAFISYLENNEPAVIALLDEAYKRFNDGGSFVKTSKTVSVSTNTNTVKQNNSTPAVATPKANNTKTVDISTWVAGCTDVIAEATGYPSDMLGVELDLEADLGIDSVQRAEIWGTMVEKHNLDKEFRPGTIRTINELATELAKLAGPTETVENTTSGQVDISTWVAGCTDVIAEATGYPSDMLGVELDLEADLGIDSVQRAEIWGTMVEKHNLDKEYRPEQIRTINELANELAKLAGPTDAPQSTSGGQVDISTWIAGCTEVIAEATGYPADMLGVELDLEADLGIDSVQRAEIWGTMVEKHNLDKEYRPEQIRTINELANELAKIATPTKTVENTASEQVDITTWIDGCTEVIAEATGYPADMLGIELDLEADLGIDSVQRAEIWGTMVEKHNLNKEYKPDQIRTISELANELAKLASSASTSTEQETTIEETNENRTVYSEVVNNYLYSGETKLLKAYDIKKFNSENIIVIVDAAKDKKEWKTKLNGLNRNTSFYTTAEILKLDDKVISEADTIITVFYQKIYSLTLNKIQSSLNKEVIKLYDVFKKLSISFTDASTRIICPITQDGTFGNNQKITKLLGSFPAGFIKSLQFEYPEIKFQLIDAGKEKWENIIEKAIDKVFPYTEVGFDKGKWIMPVMQKTKIQPKSNNVLAKNDLVLVTGGARGIVFECVFELAKQTGCSLLLTGRSELIKSNEEWLKTSSEDIDKVIREMEISLVKEEGLNLGEAKRKAAFNKSQWEIFNNFEKLKANNIKFEYKKCDVSDNSALKALINKTAEKTAISGIVHGAGVQRSKLLNELGNDAIEMALDTKMQPLFVFAEEIDFSKLKLLSAFGSIAGLFGNAGQSDYALANDLLACSVAYLGKKHKVFAQTVEWTAWAGIGMVTEAEVKRFADTGLTPLDVKTGTKLYVDAVLNTKKDRVAAFNKGALLSSSRPVSTGVDNDYMIKRLSNKYNEVEFSLEKDAYLHQHIVQDKHVVPGTFSTEIFAEAIENDNKIVKNIKFRRPLWIREEGFSVEVVKADNKLLLLPTIRPAMDDSALENLTFAICETDDIKKASKIKVPKLTKTVVKELNKLAKENTAPFYSRLDKEFSGALKSGPIFRGVLSTLDKGKNLYSLLEFTEEAADLFELSGDFLINPVIADMAVQALAAFAMQAENVMSIPYELEELQILNKSTDKKIVIVCENAILSDDETKADVYALEEQSGKALFLMKGLVLKAIAKSE